MVGLNGLHFVSWGEGDGSGAHLSLGYQTREWPTEVILGIDWEGSIFEGIRS